MIQEERLISWEMIVTIIVRNRVHVDIVEFRIFTAIELFEVVRFVFVWLDGERSLQKERCIDEENCSLAFWMLLPSYICVKINSDEQHATFAGEM